MKKLVLLMLVLFVWTAPSFAQKSFDMRYNEAVEYYTAKQYDKAITVLEAAKKSPGVTKAQIAQANKLLSQCKSTKQKQSDLNLSKENVYFSGDGQTDSLYVTAGKKWEISAVPEWMTAWAEADVLYMSAPSNESGETRKGYVEVSMGKERTAYVLVSQEKRAERSGMVRIRTNPDRAFIYIDRESGMLAEDFVLREGRHTIRIEKSGYERKDTTIVLDRDVEKGETEFNFILNPTFATVSVVIKPEDGYAFDSYPTLDISGNSINLRPGAIKSFNVDKEISYYELYEDNRIPLHPGQYVLKVAADGFLSQTRDISVSKGNRNRYEFVLTPICGTLSVTDEEDAEGAAILLDSKEVGTVPMEGMRIKSGKHTLSFIKEGYITAEPEYVIDIPENKEARFKASMHRYSAYTIASNPAYCKVYLDGKYQGTSPVRLILDEGEHLIRVEKKGFYPVQTSIRTDFSTTEHRDSIRLIEAWPLLVTADKDSLDIIISQGSGKNRVVFAQGVKTPGTVEIPVSDKPYKLELINPDLTKAWKGSYKFSKPEKAHWNVLSWGKGSPVISADWYPAAPRAEFWETAVMKNFKKIGDFKFATLRLFPGMSTSLINSSLYWETNPQQSMHYPQLVNTSGTVVAPELVPGEEGYLNTTWIPALTVLLLNEEFRMGGALTKHLDVNMLATYAWYPSLQFLHGMDSKLSFTHMSGHDAFLGVEFNSRIPVFNVHVKAGIEGFFGQANIRRPGNLPKTGGNQEKTEYRYVTIPYTVNSLDDLQFVVSVGFTLGSSQCRGQNILRIF